ncbi:hypothetical protein, partial [Escherichia coli]
YGVKMILISSVNTGEITEKTNKVLDMLYEYNIPILYGFSEEVRVLRNCVNCNINDDYDESDYNFMVYGDAVLNMVKNYLLLDIAS